MNDISMKVLLTALLIFFGCSQAKEKSDLNSFSVTFKEVGSLNEVESNEESYFSNPTKIAVDDYDNVYVLDERKESILKFSNEWEFVGSISNSGKGPGELSNPRTIFADTVLITHNQGNQLINKFTLDGDFIASFPIEGVESETKIVRYQQGFILFHVPFFGKIDGSELLHHYDSEFKKTAEEEIKVGIFFEDYNREKANLANGSLHSALILDDNTLVLALSKAYNGELYQFSKKDSEWILDKKIKGKQIPQLYSLVDQDAGAELLTFIEGKIYGYILHSESKGLFQLNNGRLVHFLKRDIDGVRELGIELYSEDLEYLGYDVFEIDKDLSDDEKPYMRYIYAKDSKDRFYIVDYAATGTRILIKELEFTF